MDVRRSGPSRNKNSTMCAKPRRNSDIPTGQLYRACKQLQEVLGNFQDSITSRKKLLAKSHEAFKRGENTFIYGVLYETEVELSRNIMQDYPAAMAAVTQAYQRL